MKKVLIASAVLFGSMSVASATGFTGSASGHVGTGGGYASSVTMGGSMAQGNVNNTGFSAQVSSNDGAAHSFAGATVTHDGVTTYTSGGSHASNVSDGFTSGQAGGSTAGAAANDYTAESWGSFQTIGVGFTGFAGFTGF